MHLTSGIELLEWHACGVQLEHMPSAEHVLNVCLAGGEQCSLIENGKTVRHGFDGAVCLFPAGGRHSRWRVTGSMRVLQLHFDDRNIGQSLAPFTDGTPRRYRFREVVFEESPVISSAARSIAQTDWTDASLAHGLDSLANWIALHMIRGYAFTGIESTSVRGKLSPSQINEIDAFIDAHLGDAIRLDDLARICNLSRYHFLRKFKNTFGHSPHAYLTKLRMSRAYQLLTDGKRKITGVALECGYNQHSQFATVFKRHFGYSPSQVQKRR
ncbi:helix-turn-helix transcriptional regulator [Trinickia fusca]|uniref:AraC family transcriptional regulator n=1 Tax=Trinickia fusca TaxID=2419777 RepID=A0A494XBQ2_9BURK|nr:AraC family transcriptional regulator [Trinickia fusca]RKP44963.1 AraC family transcriptional regulator [Trinickia fusca]